MNHKHCEIKWKTRLISLKTFEGIDKDLEKSIEAEKNKWKSILVVIIDAIMYL